MKDLTQGSISRHILAMAAPTMIGMVVQMLYLLIDLYFVADQGADAVAGVSGAATAAILVMALTQMLSVGTVTLVAHAVGASDRTGANLVFGQSLLLAVACMILTLLIGGTLSLEFMRYVSSSSSTAAAGATYLYWYLPGLALQFVLASASSALQGAGIAKPTMIVRMLMMLINIILAPVLIGGWGTGLPMGVAGAGLASTLTAFAGVAMTAVYFARIESWIRFDPRLMLPDRAVLKRLLQVGLPAGGELMLMFILNTVTFVLIRGFGDAAQAGFGIGSRILQAISLPALAVALAIPAVAGQNFGAGRADRVRETLKQALLMQFGIMAILTFACQLWAELPMGWFTRDAVAAQIGADFLRIVSINFLAAAVVFGCAGIFQALGNTWPSLVSSATRVILFLTLATWVAGRPDFQLSDVWYLLVATSLLQAMVSGTLVLAQMNRHLSVNSLFTTKPTA
jgi:putative MATE family efflux protein